VPSRSVGKIITSIKFFDDHVDIYFNDECLSLSLDTYSSYHLTVGTQLSKEDYKKILETEEIYKYLNIANAYLSKAIHTENEVIIYLRKNMASEPVIKKIIKLLKHYDLVCDEAYIQDYLEYCIDYGYGKNKVIDYLSKKGIKESDLNKISFSRKDEKEKIKKLLPKYIEKYKELDLEKKKASIYRVLLSRGFDGELVEEVLEEIK